VLAQANETEEMRMEAATQEHEIAAEAQFDPELATLYGGLNGIAPPYPMLVQPWEDEAWDEESDLDPLIFAGLLRLGP
jgi:hypothetical protein